MVEVFKYDTLKEVKNYLINAIESYRENNKHV
jgi:hypothetical protein